MLWLLYFEGSVTTSCGSLLYSCLCTCLPPHERVPSVFDKCFQADVDSRIKEEMKGKAEELDVTTFQGQVWKWMIRRRRRTGEEDCGRLALACASLVRDYEASGGHKLTSALKTIWLRAACFLSIEQIFLPSILHGLLYEYAFPHLQQTTIFRIDLFHGWFIRQGSISCCGNIEWILCPSLNTCIHVSDIWCNDMKHSSAPTSPEKEPDTKAQS